jgi:hypothetical protein
MRSLLNKPEVIEGVYYYKGMIPNPYEIVELIEATDSSLNDLEMISKWRPWESSDKISKFGSTKSVDTSKTSTTSDEIKYIYGVIISAIRVASKHYAYSNNLELGRQSPISISKYSEGKFMGPHTDEKTGAHISGVLYLNDNYLDGELAFPNQGFSIKPEAGSIIIFPSTQPYVHDPQPAKGAERYICPVFWYK